MATILISGASVAGPTLAYWLQRAGHTVTVVERSATVRGGGYPIDLRGVAVDVVERMGMLAEIEAARTGTRLLAFVGRDGATLAAADPDAVVGAPDGRAIELPRGDLTEVLYARTRDAVEYVFDDEITALEDGPDGVRVSFAHGPDRTVDLVVGADGLHSGVRRIAFGPEDAYRRDLGYHYAGFSVPNTFDLHREARIWNVPGRMATLYAVGDQPRVTALLAFASPDTVVDHRDVAAQRTLVADRFAGDGWVVPQLLSAMTTADDLYFDSVSQIHMPTWTKGRVVLIGDAAHAPSFLSGQGTSLAVAGAYVLAAELAAADGDHRVALPAYEQAMRGFVQRNQRLATTGGRFVVPATRGQLWLRNAALAALPLLTRLGIADRSTSRAASSLTLPDYAAGHGAAVGGRAAP